MASFELEKEIDYKIRDDLLNKFNKLSILIKALKGDKSSKKAFNDDYLKSLDLSNLDLVFEIYEKLRERVSNRLDKWNEFLIAQPIDDYNLNEWFSYFESDFYRTRDKILYTLKTNDYYLEEAFIKKNDNHRAN